MCECESEFRRGRERFLLVAVERLTWNSHMITFLKAKINLLLGHGDHAKLDVDLFVFALCYVILLHHLQKKRQKI